MGRDVVIDGTTYEIPTTNDLDWGAKFARWAVAVSAAANGGGEGAGGGEVYDVVDEYGADPTGVEDSTSAVQNAIYDIADSGKPGTVYFPSGTYRMQPQTAADGTYYSAATYCVIVADRDGNSINNVTFQGDGWGQTELKLYVYGGGLPDGTVEGVNFNNVLLDGSQTYCVRGNMFYIPAIAPNPIPENLKWIGLRLHGQKPRESDIWPKDGSNGNTPSFPSSTVDGTGWDFHHHPIRIKDGYNFDGFLVQDCKLDEWGGEIILYSGAATGTFTVKDSLLWGSNASIVSASASVRLDNCWIADGSNAVECSPINSHLWATDCLIEDCGQGVVITRNTVSDDTGFTEVRNNVIRDMARGSGVYLSGGIANAQVCNNTLYDASITVADQFLLNPYNVRIFGNSLYVDQATAAVGIYVLTGTYNANTIIVENNYLGRTKNAVTLGHTFTYPILYNATMAFAGCIIRNNDLSDCGATNQPYPNSSDFTAPTLMPLIYGNRYRETTTMAVQSLHPIGPALSNALVPRSDQVWLYAATVTDGTSQLIASLRTTGFANGQRITLRLWDSTNKGAHLTTATTGVVLRKGVRYLTPNTELVLEFQSHMAKWVEVEYGFHKEVYTGTSFTPTGNDLWFTADTATTLVPNVDARGCEQVTLAPVGAQNYTDAAAFMPFGVPVRVILGANATLVHNAAKIVLAGAANYAPGGTGGEVWLLKPTAASTKVNELYRITY